MAKHGITFIGILLLGLAAFGVLSGKALLQFGSVERRREPLGYWLTLAAQVILGLALIFYAMVL
ncbi:MAG TPA: hypothetical protein VL527_09250 [Dongiaceae bacterium]|jgi:hypothetical protein|nr:hypothetical protein [Dongiaceae bacterium]